ncbi:MAG: carboxymuconolactone decarboxylase family protein [Gemmatimonadales bacterium]|jgi:AhpD family alkylhydroperoxidase
MTEYLPPHYLSIRRRFPGIVDQHEALAGACYDAGPIDPKIRQLVKLGIAIGAGSQGAVASHVRQALEAGASRDEIEHAALLAVPTVGFPTAAAALSWIDEVLEARSSD